VLKNTGDAVVQIVGDDVDGSFDNTPFVGTLENGGVALAPYHDKAAAVTPALQAELDGLKADIVSGALKVSSPSTP
jgi:basic membrane protein A